MSMNLVRTGVSGVVGIGSGVVTSQKMAPINIAGQVIGIDALVEGAALVVGGAMQYLSPFTAPDVVDGLVDGGAALLGRRLSVHFLAKPYAGAYGGRGYAAACAGGGCGGSRGSVGNMYGSNTLQFS